MIYLKEVVNSKRKNKKYKAIFNNGGEVHFGQKGSSTFLDHGDEKKRMNYFNRHYALGEPLHDPFSPASLSMFLTWGPYTDLDKNIKHFNNKFFNI